MRVRLVKVLLQDRERPRELSAHLVCIARCNEYVGQVVVARRERRVIRGEVLFVDCDRAINIRTRGWKIARGLPSVVMLERFAAGVPHRQGRSP
ncbi:MAG: hypothetical protein AAGI53_06350 [Planctomycetota bacterium]